MAKAAKTVAEQQDVQIGQVVYYYPSGIDDEEPQVGIVSKIGIDSVCLNIIDPNCYNFSVRDGVRHIRDPKARHSEINQAGGWDHTQLHKEFRKLQSTLEDMMELRTRPRATVPGSVPATAPV